MDRLFLRLDLFKADDPSPGVMVTRYAGPAQKKAEQLSPVQRVKPTKMSETPHTMGLGYMAKVGSAKNREPYKCIGEGKGFAGKGCGVTVHPGGTRHIESPSGNPWPKEVQEALKQGASYVKPTTRTEEVATDDPTKPGKVTRMGHLVEHPAALHVTSETKDWRKKELGPPGFKKLLKDTTTTVRGGGKGGSDVTHTKSPDAVSAEHIDRKLCPDCHKRLTAKTVLATGRGTTPEAAKQVAQAKMSGSWPHAKEAAGLKRSLWLLGELLSKAGKDDAWVSGKIQLLMHEGKPQDQAIAIAYSMAGRSRKEKKKMSKSARLFLRADLFKSQAPMFLRADLVKGDKIPGGLAAGKTDKDFDAKALRAGAKIEMEHTTDPAVAREIARDHLTEDPHYYCKLKKMEGKKE